MRARLVLLVWVAGGAGAVAALTAAGGGDLATPPLGDPGSFGVWIEAKGGVVAAFAVLRLLGLALAWYLLASTMFAIAARLVGAASAISVADAFTVPVVRRLVESGLAVSLSLGAVAPTTSTGAASPVLVAEVSEDPAAEGVAETATLRLIEPAPEALEAPAAPPGDARVHVVQPGDHVWSIAERALAAHLGRPPTEAEIAPYWRAVLDRNAGAFVTGDPDVIFAGQTLELPAP